VCLLSGGKYNEMTDGGKKEKKRESNRNKEWKKQYKTNKLRGLSLLANYTNREIAACERG
jgi:hypothetical protein